MIIDTTKTILDYEGKELIEQKNEKPLTFFDVFSTALNATIPSEAMTAETKNEVFQISLKIYNNRKPNLTPKQLETIKDRVGKVYAPLVYGRVCQLLDGTDNEDQVVNDVKES